MVCILLTGLHQNTWREVSWLPFGDERQSAGSWVMGRDGEAGRWPCHPVPLSLDLPSQVSPLLHFSFFVLTKKINFLGFTFKYLSLLIYIFLQNVTNHLLLPDCSGLRQSTPLCVPGLQSHHDLKASLPSTLTWNS